MGFFVRALRALGSAIKAIVRKLGGKGGREQQDTRRKPTKVKFIWVSQRDDRTCKACQSKDGTTIEFNSVAELEAIYENASNPFATFRTVPPIHTNCRCYLDIVK